MRPRSLAAPLILIAVGLLFLMRNLWPEVQMFELFTRYWPLLLILWGSVRLIEVLVWHFSGRPLPVSGVSGGEWAFVVFLCVFGSMLFWGSNYYKSRWPAGRIAVRGLEIFGEPFEFPMQAEKAGVGKTPRIVLEMGRGNAKITGADTETIKVTGRKTIRAYEQADADKGNKQTPLEIVDMGSQIVIRTNHDQLEQSRKVTADIEISVPRGASVEGRGKYGDFDINDISGNVEVISDNAGVRVGNIGGSVKAELGRGDVVRAVKVKGGVDIKTRGRGQEVEVEAVEGNVNVTGSYSGQLSFRNLAKPLRFESSETDLRVEKVTGSVRIDLSHITAENIQGAFRLTTKSRDVEIRDFSQSVEISLQRGDIEIRPGKGQFGKIDARTKNGNIDFVPVTGAKFELAASTQRGEISNDYGAPFKAVEEGRGATLKGATGSGPTVNLETERGAVTVRKAGDTTGDVLPKALAPPSPAPPPKVPATVQQ